MGVRWIEAEQAYNFALFARNADRVILQLYRPDALRTPSQTFEMQPLQNKSGPVWHCRVPLASVEDAQYYAYRVAGPASQSNSSWHKFDSEKLLLDPYAQSVYFPEEFDRESARRPGSNAGQTPLGRIDVCRCPFEWGDDHRLRHGSDLVIYEMHIRGFTRHPSSDVSPEARGTFAGVIEKIPYLRELGITAVELMPVFQFDPQEENYWGYMPLNFFAPHHAYSVDPSSCEQHNEFRELVKALHESDIEVILDVVYNHTCEGNHLGPTYSFRGIDNAVYYMSSGQASESYANYSGTGNTLNTTNSAVRQLIVDSLRYWAREMHVDGFRFDLASVFSRDADGAIDVKKPPLFGQITGDPDLSRVRMIGEPWDAAGLYQLGAQFPGWAWMQWNGRYRDTLQRFVRGDDDQVADLMTRLYGSSDLFPDDTWHAFHAFQSVNYVTSHDGFTLYDLVSYNHKRNWANGHDNSDGHNDYSWNCGWEGDEQTPDEVLRLRRQQVKNFFCLLMLSNGTPMFRMGDEFLQTQRGNNNPYNQDNETSWLDWRRLEQHNDVFRFFKLMIAFRKAHPSLGRSRFWRDDVRWFGSDRKRVDMSPGSHVLAFHLGGADLEDADIYVMINGGDESLRFEIHSDSAPHWKRVVDTSLPSPDDIAEPNGEFPMDDAYYLVQARSVVVFFRE